MSDLNLDFDVGTKIISFADNSSENLGFTKENNISLDLDTGDASIMPNLTASDGVELLAKGNISPQTHDETKGDINKNEDFSFFKPDDKGGIVDGDIKIDPIDDNFIMNQKPEEVDGYKPIHRLTPQEIKNEKIDLI